MAYLPDTDARLTRDPMARLSDLRESKREQRRKRREHAKRDKRRGNR